MIGREQRRVIAVVTDAFSPFHREVLDGLWPHFSAAGYGTLALAGRDVRTDRLLEAGMATGGQHHRGFGTQLDVRGAVIVCGATPPEMSEAAIADYVANICDGPVVSLGIVLPGVPSVTIDWDDATAELLLHMVSDPRRRRFVFVRGFAGDPHSKSREAGFRAGMAAAGLKVDERLIVSGNYSVADSLNAVTRLLADGYQFDGIVAANDDMAIGAIAALTEHGLRVPDDVIVAGFDDSLASFTSEPPLTTVLLDTQRLTASSADLLLDAIETGERPPTNLEVRIESGLIKRASTQPVISEPRPTGHGLVDDLVDDLDDDLANDLAEDLFQRITSRWEVHRAPEGLDTAKLAKAVVATMLTGDDSFAAARRQSYDQVTRFADRSEVFWLRHAARQLEALTIEAGHLIPEVGVRAMVEDLAAIDKRLRPTETAQEVERQAHRQLQERLVMRLASCSDTDTLWDVLRTGLDSLGMSNAWVAANELDELVGSNSDTMMRLLFSLGDGVRFTAERFPRESVLPKRFSEFLNRDVHVVVPLRAGVSDIGYLVVELHGEFLLELEAIASGIAQVLRHVHQVGDLERQASRLRMANEALDQLARHDSLTGLANRKLFLERLEQQIDGIGTDEELSILFIDLDGFKLINDTIGHQAGDQLLRVIANRLRDVLGETDTLARLGGDEFTVILRHPMGSERATEIASKVLAAASQPCTLLGQTVSVSASIGIAQFPNDGTTTHTLTRNADTAMYAAKGMGKNQFARYTDGLAVDNSSELRLREVLQIGLDNDEFDLTYQPRLCLESGKILAFEALLRWNPSMDVAVADRQPDRFVLVAERNGLISALDAFSLDRACRQAKRWADAGKPIPVSVNMSAKRMQEADIVAQVVDALERNGFSPDLLQLEISEQALTNDIDASIATLGSLREIGVRCSIDNYGTGTSSVTDLTRLPVEMLKIDRSLIAGIQPGSDALRSKLRAIVGLGVGLGLTVIAGGIETPVQRNFLLEIGCAQGQGFMFGTGLEEQSKRELATRQ